MAEPGPPSGFAAELKKALGPRIIYDSLERRKAHDFDATDLHYVPDLVAEPEETAHVSTIMSLASKWRVPVTPRASGTGMTGGALAIKGGVCLSMMRMNRILEIDGDNLVAVVQPGVVNLHLDEKLAAVGLYYPPDPSSLESSTIGGNVAENAGGPHCLKYGVTRDYVLGMELVLPDGEVIRAGRRTRKGVVGYNITDLIVGSEGTLAVMTEITLKLIPRPRHVVTMLALFPDFKSATRTISTVTKERITPATLEFLDSACVDILRENSPIPFPSETEAILIIEVDGDKIQVDSQVEIIGEKCLDLGAIDILLADSSAKRKGIWDVRRQLSDTIKETHAFKQGEDVAVPVSFLTEFIEKAGGTARKYGFGLYSFGHLGDGNIHMNLVADDDNPAVRVAADKAIREMFRLTLDYGGTISGEHGIGTVKQPYIGMEISPCSMALQREIKKVFDPLGILNPGKIFPESD